MAKKIKEVVADKIESIETELRTDFSHFGHRAPQAEVLYGRLHKVILNAGYEASAAVSVLHEKFDEYMQDTQRFCEMLSQAELGDKSL